MASSLQFLYIKVVGPTIKQSAYPSLQIKAQSFRDEGKSSSITDANLKVLKERIEVVRIKERLERCCRSENGWNYAPVYDYKRKRDRELSQFLELLCLVGGTVGLTVLSGTFLLCIVSFLIHLNQ